jgi:hypothetical protein
MKTMYKLMNFIKNKGNNNIDKTQLKLEIQIALEQIKDNVFIF